MSLLVVLTAYFPLSRHYAIHKYYGYHWVSFKLKRGHASIWKLYNYLIADVKQKLKNCVALLVNDGTLYAYIFAFNGLLKFIRNMYLLSFPFVFAVRVLVALSVHLCQ